MLWKQILRIKAWRKLWDRQPFSPIYFLTPMFFSSFFNFLCCFLPIFFTRRAYQIIGMVHKYSRTEKARWRWWIISWNDERKSKLDKKKHYWISWVLNLSLVCTQCEDYKLRRISKYKYGIFRSLLAIWENWTISAILRARWEQATKLPNGITSGSACSTSSTWSNGQGSLVRVCMKTFMHIFCINTQNVSTFVIKRKVVQQLSIISMAVSEAIPNNQLLNESWFKSILIVFTKKLATIVELKLEPKKNICLLI